MKSTYSEQCFGMCPHCGVVQTPSQLSSAKTLEIEIQIASNYGNKKKHTPKKH